MKTQLQLEEHMISAGVVRAQAMFNKAEASGNADRGAYTHWVFNDYVCPIAEAVASEINVPKMGRARAHIALLRGLDPMTVAYLSVRCVLNSMMTTGGNDERSVSNLVGSTINRELVLAQIEFQSPELFHTLSEDLGRRLSKNERHRVNMMRVSAKKAGLVWQDWEPTDRLLIGQFLLGLTVDAGIVEFEETGAYHRKARGGGYETVQRNLRLCATVADRMIALRTFIECASPFYGPCVEPPKDWVSYRDGGFHSTRMRARAGRLIHCAGALRDWVYDSEPSPTVLGAANALQRTAWVVNKAILQTVTDMSRIGVVGGDIVSNVKPPMPEKPAWLVPGLGKESMTPEQLTGFIAWKRSVADYHTNTKLAGAKFGRFYQATRTAVEYQDYPAIYFVYFADSRGRFYPRTTGLNPQGSDLQKALLRFSISLPITDPAARRWFNIHGANKWGFDKAPLADRAAWHKEHHQMIMLCAANPVANTAWLHADKPLQFLAWALEYAEAERNPSAAVSALPISMDGSCNGLQNLSALLRDPVGGAATNLTVSETMQDIYMLVAKAAEARLRAAPPCPLTATWLEHGVQRKAVKRTVMTTPYGVTKRTSTEYVLLDYLREHPDLFKQEQRFDAAKVLMSAVWPAIGDVIVKGREAMEWLSIGAGRVSALNEPDGVVTWTSPSGFPSGQAYFDREEIRVRTRVCGQDRRIIQVTETATPSKSRHRTAMAPNFVHSLDAAHLHKVAARLSDLGIPAVAMIHDDYGTHAAHSDVMYRVIREEFVSMYTDSDPVALLGNRYPEFGEPPAKGDLDISGVLHSEYFFS